jgi:hypothetical protein
MTNSDGRNENLQLVIRLEMDITTAEGAQDLAAGSILAEVEEPAISNRDKQVQYFCFYFALQYCSRLAPLLPLLTSVCGAGNGYGDGGNENNRFDAPPPPFGFAQPPPALHDSDNYSGSINLTHN